jgi:small conductance mechanosensitive channel
MDDIILSLQSYIAEYGMKVIGAILILVIGLWITKLLTKAFRSFLNKRKIDETLVKFFTTLVNIALIVFVVIAAISKVGVETTSFIAVLGAAGFAVGLALQGSLANFASGIMLIIFRPIRVNDFIEGSGITGFVEEIGIFVTIIRTVDNRIAYVPNAKLTSDNIINLTVRGTRRVDITIGIGYKEDIDKARTAVSEVLVNDSKILTIPAPDIVVKGLGDSSVNLMIRAWCKTEDYWNVYYSINEEVKKKFDAENIEIPFPQRVIHTNSN